MNDFDKNMEKIFDVPAKDTKDLPVVTKTTPLYNAPNIEEDLGDAYQQSRENLQGIIDQGQEAMHEILEIAKAGQHPRAFEVYSGLLKNMVDANKELLNIQKQMRDMDKKKEVNNTNIDKAIFVGSTNELAKFLKDNGNK
jgi:predicted transcriptional regulator